LARRFRLASGEGNKEAGRLLMRLLGEGGGGGSGGDLSIPGCKASSHTFWLFPILVRGNAALIASALKRCGVDAGTGSSQIGIVRGWEGVRDRECAEATRLLRQVVYVPVSRRMPESRVRETARVIRAVLGSQGIETQVR
jgi:dTDP-4-amino-4,6-dideoxygalactose transaminase